MGKMKKGKAHHWYKEEKDKVPKKSYVPTGENCTLIMLARIFVSSFCPQGSREAGQRRHQGRQKQSMSPLEPQEEGSLARRTALKISKCSIHYKDFCCLAQSMTEEQNMLLHFKMH